MKTIAAILVAFAAIATGCVTPFRAPADVAHLKLEAVASPLMSVDKIWLERKGGPLVVRGYVSPELRVEDTTVTHLDVTLLDGNGRTLKSSVEYFQPRQILRTRRFRSAEYRVMLDPLPAGTATIRVAAHEGAH